MRVLKNNEELKSLIKDGSIIIEDDIKCDFNINVNANIDARNIDACNIKAWNIDARNIDAWDIEAWNIDARNIDAWDIEAWNIEASNIEAWDIEASNIEAWNIDYYAFCISYNNIVCESIKGCRVNSFNKCLDGDLTIKEKLTEVKIKEWNFILSLSEINELKKQLK